MACTSPQRKSSQTSLKGNVTNFYMLKTYILKVGISGIRDSANFFHFPPKFRLRTRKLSRLHCTIASPSVCRLCCLIAALKLLQNLYSNLYFDNLLLKTPDLCNLRTFVAIFLSRFTHFFRRFFVTEKQTPQTFSLLECMVVLCC